MTLHVDKRRETNRKTLVKNASDSGCAAGRGPAGRRTHGVRTRGTFLVAVGGCERTRPGGGFRGRARTRETRKVVIVTGIDYPGHKWKETAPALAGELRKDPRLKVDVVEKPEFLASEKLRDYNVVVLHFMNWETPDPGEQARQNLARFVREGGGVVAVHFSCGAFQGWPEFEKIVGRVYDPKLRGRTIPTAPSR